MTRDTAFSSVFAFIGLIANSFLGGWDIGLKLMVFCMVFDYVTGVLRAVKLHELSSEVMFWGGIKKSVILIVLAMAVLLDELIGSEGPVFRTLAIYFYIGKEGLSIVENLGVIGVRLPGFFYKILSQFEEKGDGSK